MNKETFDIEMENLRTAHNTKKDLFAIYDMIDLMWSRIDTLEKENDSLKKKLMSYESIMVEK